MNLIFHKSHITLTFYKLRYMAITPRNFVSIFFYFSLMSLNCYSLRYMTTTIWKYFLYFLRANSKCRNIASTRFRHLHLETLLWRRACLYAVPSLTLIKENKCHAPASTQLRTKNTLTNFQVFWLIVSTQSHLTLQFFLSWTLKGHLKKKTLEIFLLVSISFI